MLTLADLTPGLSGRLTGLTAAGILAQRFEDMGLLPGTVIHCLFASPAGTPIAYALRGTILALRRETAAQLLIEPY